MKNQIISELRKAEIEFLLELPDVPDQDRASLKKELATLVIPIHKFYGGTRKW